MSVLVSISSIFMFKCLILDSSKKIPSSVWVFLPHVESIFQYLFISGNLNKNPTDSLNIIIQGKII